MATYFLLICRIIVQFSGIIGEFDRTIDLLFVNKKIEYSNSKIGQALISSTEISCECNVSEYSHVEHSDP